MVQATINNNKFNITSDENGYLLNGEKFVWDVVKISDGYFHIIFRNKSYRAELVTLDKVAKKLTIKINGKHYAIDIREEVDLLLEKMGMSNAAGSKLNHIKAPMPGLIIELKIKAGDEVKPGDQLLILEAMKMENILKSQGAGIVKNVKVKKGDTVEKGQVLIEF